jgi:putative toxin-antitoxin system antitoxin component (TIGR02293 family)
MEQETVMLAYTSVPAVLGLGEGEGPATPIQLIDRIERGLPVETLFEIAAAVSLNPSGIILGIVPKATLTRRRKEGRLSAAEGAVVARIAAVWALAIEVWGTPDAARAFLNRPHPMIEDRKPIDIVVQSEIGGEMVSQILGRLQYGSAA